MEVAEYQNPNDHVSHEESVPSGMEGDHEHKGRNFTISIALPGSIIDNAQTLELKTYLAGQVSIHYQDTVQSNWLGKCFERHIRSASVAELLPVVVDIAHLCVLGTK